MSSTKCKYMAQHLYQLLPRHSTKDHISLCPSSTFPLQTWRLFSHSRISVNRCLFLHLSYLTVAVFSPSKKKTEPNLTETTFFFFDGEKSGHDLNHLTQPWHYESIIVPRKDESTIRQVKPNVSNNQI